MTMNIAPFVSSVSAKSACKQDEKSLTRAQSMTIQALSVCFRAISSVFQTLSALTRLTKARAAGEARSWLT